MLSYQTAWLKAHYPIEFMAALMTSVTDNKDKVVIYIDECRRMGLSVHPPDVNRSVANFTVDGKGIRFGLMAINGIGEKPIQAIIDARSEGPFVDMFDFCMRVNIRQCQKSSIDTMVKAGAFDSIEPDRATAVAWLDTCFASAQAQRKDRISGQTNLFGESSRAMAPRGRRLRPHEVRERSRRQHLTELNTGTQPGVQTFYTTTKEPHE